MCICTIFEIKNVSFYLESTHIYICNEKFQTDKIDVSCKVVMTFVHLRS